MATRSNLFSLYESMIKANPCATLKMIAEHSSLYSDISCMSDEDSMQISDSLSKRYLSLSRIEGAPSYILLLYLSKKRDIVEINDDILITITDLLIKFFVIRNTTGTPETYTLSRMFMSIIDEIEKENIKGASISEYLKEYLKNRSASIQAFESVLRAKMYEENRDVTRYILIAIAERAFTKETRRDLWKRDKKNSYVWSIEHILPQGENLPDEWVKMITGSSDSAISEAIRNQALAIQDECAHTLGNLTITAYNSALSNSAFEIKKERIDSSGNKIGYNNGLSLNDDVYSEQIWTKSVIETRTNKLVKMIIDMFAI